MSIDIDEMKRKSVKEKYLAIDAINDARAAIETLGFLTRQEIERGTDLSEHVNGLAQLQERQTEALQKAASRIDHHFRMMDMTIHNLNCDNNFFDRKAKEAEDRSRQIESRAQEAAEAIAFRMAIVAEKARKGQSPAAISADMNLPTDHVEAIIEKLRGVQSASEKKVVNG